MKIKTLVNNKTNEFLQFIRQAFAGELSFQNDETAFGCGLAAFDSFTEEWESNLLNLSRKSKLPYLEVLFFKLEQFGRFMPRGNREIEDSLAFKGLNFLLYKLPGNTPLDELANELSADFVADVRLYRLRVLLADGSSDGFATLDALDLCAHQQLLAAHLVTLAWLTLTPLYTTLGGIASAPPEKGHKRLIIKTPILEDLRSFMPEMREMTADSHPTEKDVYIEFSRHLTSIRWWNYPCAGSWQAPIEYERAFHDAPDKAAFLTGFRRLLKAIEPTLNLPDNDNPLFKESNGHLLAEDREKQRRRSIHRVRVNVKCMHQWLQARQKPATIQLLEAVEYVALVPEWDDEVGSPTNTLTVAAYLPEDELTLRFEMLLQRFQDEIPTAQSELNLLHDRLTRLVSYSTTAPSQADFETKDNSPNLADLVLLIPHFNLVDRTPDVTTQKMVKVADDFCAKLLATINHRLPWAARALNLVEIALARPTNVKDKPELSLKQIALLHVYRDEDIPRGEEANEIARRHGHNSGEKLRKHYNYYNQPKHRTGIPKDKAKAVIADIKAVITHLDGLYQQRANNELEAIRA
jgi:hypothetical protein